MKWLQVCCIAGLIACFTISAVGETEKNRVPDTHFLNEQGETVEGVRCATPQFSDAQVDALAEQTRQWLTENGYEPTEMISTIPVAFHVLRSNTGQYDVTDQQLQDQVDVLNGAFSNTNFQFTFSSVDRTNNSTWTAGNDESGFKSTLAIDPATTLNFYTGNLGGGLLGWAVFPWSYSEDSWWHGVVCLYSSLPGGSAVPYNEGDTGTHEVGHYLGLWHTFQGGCGATGDQVADTPREQSPAFGCPIGRDTCPSDPGDDPVENFMDYSDDDCMDHFTAGQSVRMDAMVAQYKPSLLDGGGNGDIPCEDVRDLRARCRPDTGTLLQAMLRLFDSSHDGETVTFVINGSDSHTATLANGRATISLAGYGAGTHSIEVTEVAGCVGPVEATCTTILDEEDAAASVNLVTVPETTELLGNYPNPFNPSTTIRYALSEDVYVTLKIYNTLGQEVASVLDGYQTAGVQDVVWDGRSNSGETVASGLYIYYLRAGDVVQSRQMMFSK